MFASVHKMLVHGKDIINAAVVPIGMLFEKAEKAHNNDYRKYGLRHWTLVKTCTVGYKIQI